MTLPYRFLCLDLAPRRRAIAEREMMPATQHDLRLACFTLRTAAYAMTSQKPFTPPNIWRRRARWRIDELPGMILCHTDDTRVRMCTKSLSNRHDSYNERATK